LMPGVWNTRDGEVAIRREMERLTDLGPAPHYCYTLQAWITGDQIDFCGHAEITPTCHACQHAGEIHEHCEGCH
ncbi:unnamed protein product, partial [marine sediment metagenome]